MEFISFNNSRVTSLRWGARLAGQPYYPKIAKALVERYHFIGFPTKIDELISDRVSFRHGAFGTVGIETLDVYNDGVIVSSRSNTSILDAFLEDVFEWVANEFGIKFIASRSVNKMYESEIVVTSEDNILKPLDQLSSACTLINKSLKKATGSDAEFNPFGLSLSADNAAIAGMRPVAFRIERKIDLPHSTNFYVSVAPLPTDDHVEVLKILEDIARS